MCVYPTHLLTACGVISKANLAAVTSKQGRHVTTLTVDICDESCDAALSIYGPLVPSAEVWKQSQTILLISSPGRHPDRRLSVEARTIVELDPDIGEAESLRRWMKRERCPVNEHFPANLFEIDRAIQAPLRIQFTLASLDGFIRASPSQLCTGYLPVILTRLDLVSLWTRRQLFSIECCGMPIYANKNSGHCGQCGTGNLELRINPNLVSGLADETGAISCASGRPGEADAEHSSNAIKKQQHSKILWTDGAWTRLLGRSPEQLARSCDTSDPAKAHDTVMWLRYLEQRLMYMRVILLVGWTGDHLGGRLAVLSVVG